MRQKVWAISKQHPYTHYKRATDAQRSGAFQLISEQTLADDQFMYDPVATAHVTDYGEQLGSQVSVADAAYRANGALVDNVLKEDNHSRNRRVMINRTVHRINVAPLPEPPLPHPSFHN